MIGEEIQHLSASAYFPDGTIGNLDYHEDVLRDEQWLVLFFYPADFTWVCPTELHNLRERYADFRELGTEVWAVSTDGVEVHKRWVEEAFEQLPFPVLSDYSISDNNVGREVGEILRLIAAFQASDYSDGQVAPCGWRPGEELLTPGE